MFHRAHPRAPLESAASATPASRRAGATCCSAPRLSQANAIAPMALRTPARPMCKGQRHQMPSKQRAFTQPVVPAIVLQPLTAAPARGLSRQGAAAHQRPCWGCWR